MKQKYYLRFKDIYSYSFIEEGTTPLNTSRNLYDLNSYRGKAWSIEFVKKPTSYKRRLYDAASVRLKYGVYFGEKVIYLENDLIFHPLTKETMLEYNHRLRTIFYFDQQLSKLVTQTPGDKKASSELVALKRILLELSEEDIVEMRDANEDYPFIWRHYIYNPENVVLDERIALDYVIQNNELINLKNGQKYDLKDHYVCKEFKVALTEDRNGIDCLKMYYGIRLKNGNVVYIYRDIVSKALTVNMVAKYYRYVKLLVAIDKQIARVIKPSLSDREITSRLYELKTCLSETEGYSEQDKKHDKLMKKAASSYAMHEFMLWDEIWGD